MTPRAQNRRAQVAAISAHLRWAFEPDRTAATAPARQAFMDAFERVVDPEAKLPEAERAKRAANFRSAHFRDLAMKSAEARRAKAEGRKAVTP